MHSSEINAKRLLAKAFNVDEKNIPNNANINNYNHWDSLAHIRIVLRLEEIIERSLETKEIIEIIDLESIQRLLALEQKG